MDTKFAIYEKRGNIVRITLNNPEKRNCFNLVGCGEDAKELWSALDEARFDDDVKVVILKGAGSCFSSGQDLSKVGFLYGFGTGQIGERHPSQRIRLRIDREGLLEPIRRLFFFPKYTIAQVHGYAYDGGFCLAMCCDFIIATEDAKFGSPGVMLVGGEIGEPHRGLVMARVGITRARELMSGLRVIDGKEAQQIGLITRAVSANKLDDEVEGVAQKLCQHSRDGIAIGKEYLNSMYEAFGLESSITNGFLSHTMFTNLRFEPDEVNYFKERRDKGMKAAFKERDERWVIKLHH